MSEIKATIFDQMQQLQILMHRASFHSYMGGVIHNPHRGQGRVLAILKLKPEISQKELGYLLNMSKQALAELLAKLEKSGYITREPAEDDKRVMMIKLTEAGRNAAEDVDDSALEAFRIFDCLTPDELAAFSAYLGRLIRRYEELFPDDDFAERRRMMEDFVTQHGRGRGYAGFGMRTEGPRNGRGWRGDIYWGNYDEDDPDSHE
jgi:DNA-binding MarR family transcriptional regulator